MRPLRILRPCDASWDSMHATTGDARAEAPRRHVEARHCAACDAKVHDLTTLSEAAAYAYVHFRAEASLCVRILAIGAAVAACGPAKPSVTATSAPPPAARSADVDSSDTLDPADKCPDAPDPRSVAEDGCPAPDADHDGIPDASDACPKEPGKASADAKTNGCPQNVVIVSQGITVVQSIHFARASTTPDASSAAVIEETISVLKANPAITALEVAGHASSDEPSAQTLSEKRSKVVVAKMVAAGVDPKRLVARGYGSSRPFEAGTTPLANAKNRRVSFQVAPESCLLPPPVPR